MTQSHINSSTFNQKSVTKNNEPIVRCNQEVGQWTDWNSWNIRDQLARQILEEDDFVDWPCSSIINSESLCILGSSIVHGKNQWKSRKDMEGENWVVYEFIPMSRIGSNQGGADGVRVEDFPRIHYIADSRRDPDHDDWNTMWTWALPRTDHLHVNVQRHLYGLRFQNRSRIGKKIRARTLVVSWAWIRKEMVRNSRVQTEWKMGSCRWGHDAQLQSMWTSRIPWQAKRKLSIHFCGDDNTQASAFMGKNYSDILHSINNTGKALIMKQMFDISEKLIVGQSDEIYGVHTFDWMILHGNIYLW